MDSHLSRKAIPTGCANCGKNHETAKPYDTRPTTSTSSSNTRTSSTLPRLSRPIASAIEDAQPRGDGIEIVLHSNIVTGKELKRALDDMFPGPQEYFVQLRRDRYRITLPKHNKEDIKKKMSR